MRKITLGELLQYYDMEEKPVDRIQLVTRNREWDDAEEVFADTVLMEPFTEWTVMEMRCEESYVDKKPIIRVYIDSIEK